MTITLMKRNNEGPGGRRVEGTGGGMRPCAACGKWGVGGWGGQKQKHERDMRETPSGTRV